MRTFILALLATGSLALAGCGDSTETGAVPPVDSPSSVEPLPGAQPETVDPVAPDPNTPVQ